MSRFVLCIKVVSIVFVLFKVISFVGYGVSYVLFIVEELRV